MNEIDVIKQEIDTDPLARGYSGMTDQQVADDLNTANRSVARFVTAESVRNYLITEISGTGVNQRSTFDMIREYAEDGTVRGASEGETAPAARRSAARMIWQVVSTLNENTIFPVDNSNVQTLFTSIGPDGGNGPSVLSGAQLTAIAGLATQTVTRATELGIPAVKVGWVERARA